jgi:hypothetical protein
MPLKISGCAVFDICPANNSSANSNPLDETSYESRAKRSISICSNIVKIKSASSKTPFVPKL